MNEAMRSAVAAMEEAGARGATGVEVLRTDVEGFEVRSVRGRALDARPVVAATLTVRVWLDGGREGRASGAASSVHRVVESALASARDAARSPRSGPSGRSPVGGVATDIADRRYEALGRADRLEVLATVERAHEAVERSLHTFDLAYRDEREIRTFVSTAAIRYQERGTRFRVQGGVRDPVTALQLFEILEDRSFATVASMPFTASLARRLVALRGPGPTVEGPIRVAMSPWSVAQIVGALAPHLLRSSLQSGSSFLAEAQRDGPLALSPLFHLLDDGMLPGGLASRSFDDRGVAPVPLALIRDGHVEGWYVGVDEARACGLQPTGHDRGGFLHPSNLIVRSGLRSMNAVLAEQTEPVLAVDHLRGLEEGFDPISGSVVCEASGHLVRPRNVAAGPVARVRLTGNLREILSRVVDLSSDTDRYGAIDAAGLLVDGWVAGPVGGVSARP